MSKLFTLREDTRQKETAYILYMILGSYYKKCTFCSAPTELTLYLYYKEMQENKQIRLEEEVIRHLDELLESKKRILAETECKVYLREEDGFLNLTFASERGSIRVSVDGRGKYLVKGVRS